MKKPPYVDLHALDEDARIAEIGKNVMGGKLACCFITDAEPGKAERYISKLKAQFPGIVVLGRWNGPVRGVVTVKVAPPDLHHN